MSKKKKCVLAPESFYSKVILKKWEGGGLSSVEMSDWHLMVSTSLESDS